MLLKLTPPDDCAAGPVAVRIFGDNTELMIDRRREIKVLLQLNDAGFGAPVSLVCLTTLSAMQPTKCMLQVIASRHGNIGVFRGTLPSSNCGVAAPIEHQTNAIRRQLAC